MKRLIFFVLIMIAPGIARSEPPKGMILVPAGDFTMGTDASPSNVMLAVPIGFVSRRLIQISNRCPQQVKALGQTSV